MGLTVLHVGMPKTGSTALQLALAAEGFLANASGDYRDITWGMNAVGFTMERATHYRSVPVLDCLPHGQVLSDENLTLAERPEALSIITAWNPSVILLVNRGLASLSESWYRMLVRHGETRMFDEWAMETLFEDPRENIDARRVRPDYAGHIWQPDRVREYDHNLLPWFSRTFLRGHRFSWKATANPSLSSEATEALRRWQIVHDAPHDVLAAKSKSLPKSHGDPLMSYSSAAKLLRYDAEIRDALTDYGIAQLKPFQITTRPLDEVKVRQYLREIEEVDVHDH